MKTLFFLIVAAIFFVVLFSEMDAHQKMNVRQDWSKPVFKDLNVALTTCDARLEKSEECGKRRLERSTAIVAARTCEKHKDQPACGAVRATIKRQQAQFDALEQRVPAMGDYVVEVDSFWAPDNDWLDTQWTPSDRMLALKRSLNRHFWQLLWVFVIGILVGCVWVACRNWIADRHQKLLDEAEQRENDAIEEQRQLELSKQLKETEERRIRHEIKDRAARERAAREQEERDWQSQVEAQQLLEEQKAEAECAAVAAEAERKLRKEIENAIEAALAGVKPKSR